MNKKILTALMIFGLASGVAQASIPPIIGVHDTAQPNSIESYYIQANATGSANIFLNSQQAVSADPLVNGLSMNGLLSVWQQVGSNWTLVGANDDAPRQPSNSVNVYGVNVHDWQAADPLGGISDPGLTLNLTAGSNYLIIQSDTLNGPKGLSNDQILSGVLGQTFAVGSNLQAALWGKYEPWGPAATTQISGFQLNNYALTITGDVKQISAPAAVPLPAAVWLFGSALAGLGVVGRKKAESRLAA